MPSRRQFLAAAGATTGAGLVGWHLHDDDPPEPLAYPEGGSRQPGAWPSFNGDSANTSHSPVGTPLGAEPEVLWRSRVAHEFGYPVVFDGVVFYPDLVPDGGEGLRAFDAADGTERWHATDAGVRSPPVVVPSAVDPAGEAAGVVVGAAGPRNELRAYTFDGDVAWRTPTPDGSVVQSAPAYHAPTDSVYAGTTEGTVVRVDAASGEVEWSTAVFGRVRSGCGLAVGAQSSVRDHDAVFVTTEEPTSGGAVSVLTAADGERRSLTTLTGGADCPPTTLGELTFVTDTNGVLYAIAGQSGVRWRHDLTDGDRSVGGIATDGRTLYVAAGGDDGWGVTAVAARSGDRRWSHGIGDYGAPSTPPVVVDDTIHVPTREGLVALNAAGGWLPGSRTAWRWEPDIATGDAVVAADGRLFAILDGEETELVALE